MKFNLIYLGLLLFTVVSFAHLSWATHKEHKQKSKTHLQNKAKLTQGIERWLTGNNQKSKQCKWVCEDDTVIAPKNATKYFDGSWSYQLQLSANELIHIGYNISTNFLAILNPHLNITWITDGIYIGVINVTSDALLLIDTTKGIGSLFNSVGIGFINAEVDIMLYFSNSFNALLSSSIHLSTNFAFRVNSFLRAIQDHTLEAFFHGHLSVLNALGLNFNIYINGSMKINLGFNAFLQPVLGMTSFSLEVYDFCTSSITYGTKLTIQSMQGIFINLGKLSFQLEVALRSSVNSVISIGHNTLQAFWGLGATFAHTATSTISIVGGGSIHISSGLAVDQSWEVNFGNSSAYYELNYNATLNTFGFYNGDLEIALIAFGNTGNFAIFNVTSGIGFFTEVNGSAVILTDHTDDITTTFQANITTNQKLLTLIALTQNETIEENGENSFRLDLYISSYLNGSSFNGSTEIGDLIDDNFSNLFDKLDYNDDAQLFIKYGVAIMYNAVFGNNAVGKNLGMLFDLIYIENSGKFSHKIMKKVYAIIKANMVKGNLGFKSFIFAGIKACFGGGLQLAGFNLSLGKC